MSNIKAVWYAQLLCVCPHCQEDTNLMESPDFWVNQPEELEISQRIEDLDVVCPECGHEFKVDTFW